MLLEVVLPKRSITVEGVLGMLKYCIKRNYTAYLSHRGTRLQEALKLGIDVSL